MIEYKTQRTAQAFNSAALLCGHGVLWVTAVIKTANVADTNAVFVVAFSVCAGAVDGSAALNGAVKLDHKVVSDVRPITGRRRVPGAYRCCMNVLVFFGRTTVQNDAVNLSHVWTV